MIIGRDLINEQGIDLMFSEGLMRWSDTMSPMKDPDSDLSEAQVVDSKHVEDATERIKKILDAKYEPANLDEVVADCKHLTIDERKKLRKILEKYKQLFDGSLGKWKNTQYDIELQPNVSPYHTCVFLIPRIHKKSL